MTSLPQQSPRVNVHATSVVLSNAAAPFGAALDAAVLLVGASGAGKSDVALRLIGMGAKLISDDQTALFVQEGRLFAGAPDTIRTRMEIRGAGIVGLDAAPPAPVVLAVRLDPDAEIPRMPEPAHHALPHGLKGCAEPPFIILRPFEASTPAKIAATASAIARGAFVAGVVSPSSDPFF